MTGGADTNKGIAWIKCLAHNFTKPSILSVASSPTINVHNTTSIAKADSGATFHFLKPEHRKVMKNVIDLQNGPKATLPNNEVIQASCSGILPFPSVSQQASKALVYPGLQNESLLSIGQFCDDNCNALFTKTNVYIIKNDEIIIVGHRNQTDGLWDIQLPMKNNQSSSTTSTLPKVNYIITKDKSKSDLAQYLLATAYSPAISTLDIAVSNGNFISWPGIDELNFKRLLGTTIPVEKGHMDQERKNLRSTTTDEHLDFSPFLQKPKSIIYLRPSKRTTFYLN